MHRIVFDVQTGETTQIELTAEEVAEIEAAAQEQASTEQTTGQ
jgi:hypothetical protein